MVHNLFDTFSRVKIKLATIYICTSYFRHILTLKKKCTKNDVLSSRSRLQEKKFPGAGAAPKQAGSETMPTSAWRYFAEI